MVLGIVVFFGSDVYVDFIDDEGGLKYFVYILRDFLGDGSFSYIEEGIMVIKFLGISRFFSVGVGVEMLNDWVFIFGVYFNVSLVGGEECSCESFVILDFEFREWIEIFFESDFVGIDVDVLVGIGVFIR